MLQTRWDYEAVKRIIARAKAEESDLETVLVDELTRYLQGEEGLFSELAVGDNVSLKEVIDNPLSLGSSHSDRMARLHDLIAQADDLGMGLLDVLVTEVDGKTLGLHDALGLAFQFGKRVVRLADEFEDREYFDRNIKSCERRAVERELVTRHYRRLESSPPDSHQSGSSAS